METREDRPSKVISDAVQGFHDANQDLAEGTKRNYRRSLNLLQEFLKARGLESVDEVDVEHIDAFRASRSINALSWTKELQILRHFFRFCVDRRWASDNPASRVSLPRNIKPTDKEPYSRNDIVKIIAACDSIGRTAYERLRARAMVLLLRYTALRISDVALLARDRVRNNEIYLRTTKNGKPIKLPVHAELQSALDMLPVPRGAEGESKYFFWSGNGSERSMIRDATRTVEAVFRASQVSGAHAHRFRHTLATELLEAGGSIEDAAEVLGNSPMIIRKHYAKWSFARQQRISSLMQAVFSGTKLVQMKNTSVNDGEEESYLVDGMGFEPTTPALRTPCSPS